MNSAVIVVIRIYGKQTGACHPLICSYRVVIRKYDVASLWYYYEALGV